jgi:MFS family permease
MVSATAERDGPAPWRSVFRGPRGRLTVGLLLLEALAATQVLVVATIMPSVRDDLGMVQLYGLAFTMSSLATIAAIPIAGRALDRFGARRLLGSVLCAFGAGLLVDATAVSMPVFLVGQFLVGAGGGGLYAISLGVVATSYPDELRARVLALLSTMWILPGLLGPPIGALIASTIGWRWAFIAPIPVLVAAWVIVLPSLNLVPGGDARSERISVRWPLQVMLGAGIVFVAITAVRWWAIPAIVLGAVVCVAALRRLVPAGTFRAARGLPAVSLEAFFLSCGFFAADAFVTLMLVEVRGLTLAAAGATLTAATVAWSVGSAWQSGRVERVRLSRLVLLGGGLVVLADVALTVALRPGVPVVVALAAPVVAGLGMGIAFPTLPLAAMRMTDRDGQAGELSGVLLMDVLGTATGTGLAGGIVAVALARGADLTAGLAGTFLVAIAMTLGLIVLAPRISPERAATEAGLPPAA